MKKILPLSILFLAVLPGMGQAPPTGTNPSAKTRATSPLADYAGEWTSSFDGRVWLQLHLTLQGGKLTGSMVHSRHIATNDSGGLKSVSEEQSSETVTDAVLNPDGLVLTLKDADSLETDRYLMRLVLPSKQAGDLRVIGEAMPPGMAKPKPWPLVKAGNAASSPQ